MAGPDILILLAFWKSKDANLTSAATPVSPSRLRVDAVGWKIGRSRFGPPDLPDLATSGPEVQISILRTPHTPPPISPDLAMSGPDS